MAINKKLQTVDIEAPPVKSVRGKGLMAFAVFVVVIIAISIPTFAHHSTAIAASEQTALVSISSTGLSPATIQVKVGTDVTWLNNDTAPHLIASDPYPTDNEVSGFDSTNALLQGDEYSYTFDKAGTYTYHDNLNPYTITGSVIVKN